MQMKTGLSFINEVQSFPTVGQYLDTASQLDNYFSLQSTLSNLEFYFRYISTFEIFMFGVQIMFMLARAKVNSVAYCILGLVHPARALFGFLILRRLPDSDKLLN